MPLRNIFKYSLLIFVAVSVVFLVYSELKKKDGNIKTTQESNQNTIKSATCEGSPDCDQKLDFEVFAYYFHGYKRCYTCKTIQANIESTLKNEFKDELESGVLNWKEINMQKPENSHFVNEFDLKFSTLVVGSMENGKLKGWKRLDDVWKLVRNKPAFSRYVSQEISSFLKGVDL